MFTTFSSIPKLYHLRPKILATKWRMDIGRDGYWKPHVRNSSALSAPKISKAVAAQKNKLMCKCVKKCVNQLTYHLKYFLMVLPVVLYYFIDSPIFNRWIFNRVLNIFWWKDSIPATYSGIGGIHWELNRYGQWWWWRRRRHTLNLYYYRNLFFIRFRMYEFEYLNLYILICMRKTIWICIYEFV